MTAPLKPGFWSELRRRRVVRVVTVYAVAAWVVVQVADVFFPALRLPDEALTLVAALAILGLPVTAVTAWVFDWTPEGIRRTGDLDQTNGDGPTDEREGSPVLAVLPFDTVGEANPTFTQGIHGDILTRLSGVSGLDVIARSSVMQYRGVDSPDSAIARDLGVGWILRGEVQQVGQHVQVNARLVDARRDRQAWAEGFLRELSASNLFEIQGEITRQIVAALATRLGQRRSETPGGATTDDLEAYRLYAQGRGLLGSREEGAMRKALVFFQRAIDRDPEYAQAWAGLADALTYLETFGHPTPEAAMDAEAAADRALHLDSGLAEAHFALSNLAHARRNDREAVRRAQRAIDLRPSYADAYNLLSWMQKLHGRPGAALESARRAAELDPLGAAPLSNLALAHLALGDADEAAAQAHRLVELHPGFPTGRFIEALSLYHLQRYDEARPLLRELHVAWAPEAPAALAALVSHGLGETANAEEESEQIEERFSALLLRAVLDGSPVAVEELENIERWEYWPTFAARYFFPAILGPTRAADGFDRVLARIGRSWGIAG